MMTSASFFTPTRWHRLDLFATKWGKPTLFWLGGWITSKALDVAFTGDLPGRAGQWSLGVAFTLLTLTIVLIRVVAHVADRQRETVTAGPLLRRRPFDDLRAEAMFEEISRGPLTVDRVVTIALAPRLDRGWQLDHVHLALSDTAGAEPPAQDANDGRKIAIRRVGLAGSDLITLPLEYEVTRYSSMQTMLGLSDHQKVALFAELDAGHFDFPHAFCSHGMIVTSDRKMLLTQRSERLGYYPSAWSCSIEEQMKPEDLLGEQFDRFSSLRVCTERMLKEELGLDSSRCAHERTAFIDMSDVRCLSIFAETDLPNIAAAVYVPLRMTAARLERWLDECERPDHEFIDYALLGEREIALELAKGINHHPTSRYRMTLVLQRLLGAQGFVAACDWASRSDREPMTRRRQRERAERLQT